MKKNDDGDWKHSPSAGKERNNQLEGTIQFVRWLCGAVEIFSVIDRLIVEKIIYWVIDARYSFLPFVGRSLHGSDVEKKLERSGTKFFC